MMSQNPDVVYFDKEDCADEGDYLLRLDEGEIYKLTSVPRRGRRFSPDSRHVLVHESGVFRFYDSNDPDSLILLWEKGIKEKVANVVVADAGRFVAFRTDWESGPVRSIFVVSGEDGKPVCRLEWLKERPTAGPLAFYGDYLFVGMGFGWFGTALGTEFIHLYDLGSLNVNGTGQD